MKNLARSRRILAVMLCIMMMLGIMQTSVFAAKDKFTSDIIDTVAISGITPPKAGEYFDFTADVSSSKYEVVSIAYLQQYGRNYVTNTSSTPAEGIIYEVSIILRAADGYYFKTTSQKTSAVSSATVNGASANASNNVNTALYTPKASESADVYRKYLTVAYQFPATPAADPIESFRVSVKKPEVGGYPATKVTVDTVNGKENNGYINVDDVEWTLQNGDPMGDKFEFGETYILSVTLTALSGRNFVVDPTNILSTKENPMPKVNVTVNGASASAFPTYDGKSPTETIEVRYVFRLTEAKKISEIEINGFSAPKTGSFPSYVAIMPVGVDLAGTDSGTSKNGITWIEAGSSAVPTFGYTFAANTVYIVKLELEAEKGYEFDDPTVKIDGKTCEVDGDKSKITVTYAFSATGNSLIKSVNITGIEAPEIGKAPDYTAELGSTTYELDNTADRFTKNGVSWHNVDKKSDMYVGADKFEEGGTYTVTVILTAKDGYDFAFKDGKPQVMATVNGKTAEVSARSESELYVTYTYPVLTKTPHVCKPEKVDEVKVTCDKDGQKAYYLCKECGKCFEDEKGTKVIENISEWGITEAKGHNYGTTWGYKDALVHAHTCKTCGKPDTSVPHSGGKATCKALAKCEECRESYGDFGPHKFNGKNKCTLCNFVLPFTDVKNSDYFIDAVAWAYENGITKGMSDTEFGSALTCTRGQVVTFLWRSAGAPEPVNTQNPFTDVKESDYFYKAVLWAVENGITNGTSATTFTPNQTCSTAHIITFLYRAVNEGANGWYEEAANWATKNGLLVDTGLAVNPDTPCPRSAVVVFLYRFYH